MKLILLLATLMAAVGQVTAEDPAKLLERAIYMEQTQGDVQSALALYQRVVTSSASDKLRAQAAAHIRDINARNPSAAFVRIQALGSIRKPGGEVVNGRFRHFATGIEFAIPAGWSVEYQGPAADAGDELRLKGDGMDAEIVIIAETNTPQQIEQRIQTAVGARTRRMHDSETESQLHPENHMRWDEARESKIAGQRAIIYSMDLIEKGAPERIQYMMDIVSAKCLVRVAARSAKTQLPLLQALIDSMIGTATIP